MNFSWPYIAGFFDGEGSVFLRSGCNYIAPIVQIYQGGPSGKALLEAMQSWLAERGIERAVISCPRPSGHGKVVFVLRFEGRRDVSRFISSALPHLHIKKAAAQDVLRFVRMYPQRRGRRGDWQCKGIAKDATT